MFDSENITNVIHLVLADRSLTCVTYCCLVRGLKRSSEVFWTTYTNQSNFKNVVSEERTKDGRCRDSFTGDRRTDGSDTRDPKVCAPAIRGSVTTRSKYPSGIQAEKRGITAVNESAVNTPAIIQGL